jgi:hypothetical protein
MTSSKQTHVLKTLAIVAGVAGTAGFLTIPIATYLASHPETLSGLISTPAAIAQTSTGGAGGGTTGGGSAGAGNTGGGTTGSGTTGTGNTGSGTSINGTGTGGLGTGATGGQTEGVTPSTTQQAPGQGAQGGVVDPGAQGIGGETSPNDAVQDLRQSPVQAPGNTIDNFRQNPGGSTTQPTNQQGTPAPGRSPGGIIPGGTTGPTNGINNNQTQGTGNTTGAAGRREVVSPGVSSGNRSTTGVQQVPQYIPQPQAQQPLGQPATTQPNIAQTSPQQPYTQQPYTQSSGNTTTAQQTSNGETYGQAVRALW